jgi:hypothetical protein
VGRRSVVDEVRLHVRQLAADALEQRRELGVDEDDRGVAVVGDVGRLLVGEAVVERHRRRTELAGRVHHHDDARGVLAAPHDLGVLADADVAEHVGEPVRFALELRVRQRADVDAEAVVDDGELVGLRLRVGGQEVRHGAYA